jgi:hypothetical protein
MQDAVDLYVRLCDNAGVRPNQQLLDPILETLHDLKSPDRSIREIGEIGGRSGTSP